MFKKVFLSVRSRFLSEACKNIKLYTLRQSNVMSSFTSSSSSSCKDAAAISADSMISDAELIVANAHEVRRHIDEHCTNLGKDGSSVALVLVSKTKPTEDIQALYDAGFRHFGENYFQELLDKAASLPKDIQWHFIGHLQSSKSARLVREVSSLNVVETVDSIKLAGKLNNGCVLAERSSLDIYIQVDTSGEDTKFGVASAELCNLVKSIQRECPRLCIRGLMTIGAPGDATCFDRLVECAAEVQILLDAASEGSVEPLPRPRLVLSMGMSGDYAEAITRGSTSVRVGSTIFGARIYAN